MFRLSFSAERRIRTFATTKVKVALSSSIAPQ